MEARRWYEWPPASFWHCLQSVCERETKDGERDAERKQRQTEERERDGRFDCGLIAGDESEPQAAVVEFEVLLKFAVQPVVQQHQLQLRQGAVHA
jgi:hypothetical protein